jgi:hypothetical protein
MMVMCVQANSLNWYLETYETMKVETMKVERMMEIVVIIYKIGFEKVQENSCRMFRRGPRRVLVEASFERKNKNDEAQGVPTRCYKNSLREGSGGPVQCK